MSPKITVLPDDVANHIAAGEVIERPASVVKELTENAIDAGATQIDIDIGLGGKAYIRVKDNGHGMSRENARLAFERHATSKITCTDDIAKIATLGFRGEALPSIASVSKLKLLTQPSDETIGTRIEIHGGEMVTHAESGASPGTFIEVSDLFYKTPARLKFLKSPATELSYINNIITDLALANPRHRKAPLPPVTFGTRAARAIGIALLAISILFAFTRFGAYQGAVAWIGMASIAGVALVLLMSRWPRLALGLWLPATAIAALCLIG